jgi:hypothetical protein
MSPAVILAGIVLIPIVLLMVLRVNAALVFLSLCLGDVLVQFVGGDARTFLSFFSAKTSHQVSASHNSINLVLLLLPVVLTAIFMIRTVKGSKLILNALPAAGVGLLGGLLVVPLLPAGLAHNVIDSSLWSQAQRAQDLIVSGSAVVCLLALWLQRPKTGGEGKHGKHHKA